LFFIYVSVIRDDTTTEKECERIEFSGLFDWLKGIHTHTHTHKICMY